MSDPEELPNSVSQSLGAPSDEPRAAEDNPLGQLSVEVLEQLLSDVADAGKLGDDAAKAFGVRPEILNRFLILFRDRYRLVDKANFFLELEQGVSGINVAITNQRDALSHFVTLLSRPDFTEEQQLAQLAHAEEHLRRATLEPYAIAVALEAQKLLEVREIYAQDVLPFATDPRLSAAPHLAQIDAVLREMRQIRSLAREAKARNTWDSGWEEGISSLVAVFTQARQMHERLAHHITIARQILESSRQAEYAVRQVAESERQRVLERRNRHLTILSIVLAIISIILTVVLAA